jgi:uncharacterized protein involved in exopolysaccharide biosynthesis
MISPANPGGSASPARDVRLLDLVAVLLRRRRLVAGFTIAAGALGLVGVLLQPPVYKARTVLVPYPEQNGSSLSFAGGDLPAGLPQILGGGGSESTRLFEAVLKSKALRDTVAFRLARRDSVRRGEIYRALGPGARLKYDKLDNSMTVEISAGQAALAQQVANAVPTAINDIAAQMRSGGAAYRERFLREQLVAAREDLVQTEQRLLTFQSGRGTPDIEEQSRQTVAAAAALQEGIGELEVRVAQLRRSVTPGNPALRAAETELATRRAQLRRLAAGQAGNPVFVPLRESPELKVAATRLAREYAANEQVYGALTAALAQSQIDANNRLPALAVLDRADLPTTRDRGRALLVLVASLLAGLIMGVAAAFMREHLALAGSREGEPFEAAWREFKSDFGGMLRPWRRAGAPR